MGDTIGTINTGIKQTRRVRSAVMETAETLQIKVGNYLYNFMLEMTRDDKLKRIMFGKNGDMDAAYNYLGKKLLARLESSKVISGKFLVEYTRDYMVGPGHVITEILKAMKDVFFDADFYMQTEKIGVKEILKKRANDLSRTLSDDLFNCRNLNNYKIFLKKQVKLKTRAAGKKIRAARKLSGGAKWVGRKTAEEGGGGFFRRARRVLTEAGEFVTKNLPKWARRIRP